MCLWNVLKICTNGVQNENISCVLIPVIRCAPNSTRSRRIEVRCKWDEHRQQVLISLWHSDIIMGTMTFQITSFTIVYSIVYSSVDQRKQKSCASLDFVRGIQRWPMNSPHKRLVTRKMFPFDNVIMCYSLHIMAVYHAYNWKVDRDHILCAMCMNI